MVTVELRFEGVEAFAGELRRVGDRLRRPPGLDRGGRRMVDAIRAAIRGGDVPGPGLAPATVERRRRGGYSGPPLVRTGALEAAVDVLEVASPTVDVGIRSASAASVSARGWDLLAAVDGVVDDVLDDVMAEVLS